MRFPSIANPTECELKCLFSNACCHIASKCRMIPMWMWFHCFSFRHSCGPLLQVHGVKITELESGCGASSEGPHSRFQPHPLHGEHMIYDFLNQHFIWMCFHNMVLASFPCSSAWAERKEPGTDCLRMLSSSRISGNLEIFRKICSVTLTSAKYADFSRIKDACHWPRSVWMMTKERQRYSALRLQEFCPHSCIPAKHCSTWLTQCLPLKFTDRFERSNAERYRRSDIVFHLKTARMLKLQLTSPYLSYRQKDTKINPSITQAITEFPTPANSTELQSFISLVNQLSAITPTIATLLAPLQPLLSTKNEYTWTEEFEAAFANVKKSLTSAPILSYFDQDKETRLCTDASRQGLSFVLQQKTGNTWSLIQTGSRFLSDPKSWFTIIELELLAVAWAITKCDVFLAGLPHFTVVTDHHLLIPILNNHRLESHHKHRGTTPHNQTSQSCRQRSGIPETQILHHIRISPTPTTATHSSHWRMTSSSMVAVSWYQYRWENCPSNE